MVGGVVRGDADHPANAGKLCIKGSTLADTLDDSNRLRSPSIDGVKVSWDRALDKIASGFAATIAAHGPDSVAFYGSGQFLTEDYYVANKFIKGFAGTGNIDTNSRLCMASTVAGHIRAFGEDIVPGSYEDIDEADLIVLVGANAAWCHPILFERALAARAARGARIVVVDPRRTASAALADLHVPVRPDGDIALFARLLVALAARGHVDEGYVARHTGGLAQALAVAAEARDEDTGVEPPILNNFIDWFCATERVVTLFSQGVNQSVSGTDKVNAIINVHLATGRIGRPGMGPFSLTGQPNAMGGREVGGLANQLAAHLRFTPADLALLRGFWGAPNLTGRPGLKALDMFEAMLAGRIKAVWIAATNPAESMPQSAKVRAALAACPLVVVSDCWPTATTRHAKIVLPAAGWGEKDGTVTNSARTISRQRAFRAAPGEAKPDWWMICEVAKRMGFGAAFNFAGPAAIFREHAALSGHGNDGSRLFDISQHASISDAEYDALAPFTWGEKRYFGAAGRANIVPVRAPARVPDRGFGFILNTGRLRDQWHTMTRTGFVPKLLESGGQAQLALHPEDAEACGIGAGDLVRVTTRHGEAILPASLEAGQRRGEIFAAMHWTDEHSAAGSIGRLIGPARDKHSGQPALKSERAAIARVAVAWAGVMQSRAFVRPVGRFFASRVPLEGGLHRVSLAGWRPLHFGPGLADWAAGLCGAAAAAERIEFSDAGRGMFRLGLVQEGRLQACLFLAPKAALLPDPAALDLLFTVPDWGQDRAAMLLARAQPAAARDRMVCVCHRVSEAKIRAAITAQNLRDINELGRVLKAGTNCGSCKGELAAILQSTSMPELVT